MKSNGVETKERRDTSEATGRKLVSRTAMMDSDVWKALRFLADLGDFQVADFLNVVIAEYVARRALALEWNMPAVYKEGVNAWLRLAAEHGAENVAGWRL